MQHSVRRTRLSMIAGSILVIVFIAGCGGGGVAGTTPAPQPNPTAAGTALVSVATRTANTAAVTAAAATTPATRTATTGTSAIATPPTATRATATKGAQSCEPFVGYKDPKVTPLTAPATPRLRVTIERAEVLLFPSFDPTDCISTLNFRITITNLDATTAELDDANFLFLVDGEYLFGTNGLATELRLRTGEQLFAVGPVALATGVSETRGFLTNLPYPAPSYTFWLVEYDKRTREHRALAEPVNVTQVVKSALAAPPRVIPNTYQPTPIPKYSLTIDKLTVQEARVASEADPLEVRGSGFTVPPLRRSPTGPGAKLLLRLRPIGNTPRSTSEYSTIIEAKADGTFEETIIPYFQPPGQYQLVIVEPIGYQDILVGPTITITAR